MSLSDPSCECLEDDFEYVFDCWETAWSFADDHYGPGLEMKNPQVAQPKLCPSRGHQVDVYRGNEKILTIVSCACAADDGKTEHRFGLIY